MKHTQEEIVARIELVRPHDWMGAESGELIRALDKEHVLPYLVEGADVSGWQGPVSDADAFAAARDYLAFAVGKAEDHRGLSASRSVDHYKGWVWLLEPDRFDEFADAGYTNYGAPMLQAAADILGFGDRWAELVPNGSPVANMAQGLPCEDGCFEGCGG